MKKKKKSSFLSKIIISFLLLLIIGGGLWIYKKYNSIYQPNITLHGKKTAYFYIPTGSTFADVVNRLYEKNYILNTASFEWLAEVKKLKNNIHPGRYLIKANMSNDELINLLRSGRQKPVQLILNTLRTKEQLASKISKQIEADSLSLLNLLHDADFSGEYNLTNENVLMLFIPNTYEFYWNTSAKEFFERMTKEYNRFWTEERKARAEEIGLSRAEVSILASIVGQETTKNDEKPLIAGVYINRLKKGMRLEADPTLIYAIGDFSIRRVLNVHKDIDSPYNTYKYTGLPPGPICLPSIASLDAVLNYQKHDYIFFCAKEDFSGYHNFAKTYAQHIINARKFRRELNKRKIWN
ncbi:endolytic transglycosylase MltG [bacterium AH-315-M05]|nr:endolytic transglycosylase MltG [bacterium AH-315-M05]